MRKFSLVMLLALFCVAGCTQEEIVRTHEKSESNKISFSSYSSVVKGTPINSNAEFLQENNSFGVTAFISTSNAPYMGLVSDGTCIKSDGNIWGYNNPSDVRYWPTKGEKLNFYAYYPYNDANMSNLAFTKALGITFNYTVPTNVEEQVDLMFAVATDIVKPANDNKVNLAFKHTLTQVHFRIATKIEGLFVDLKENGITINNIKSTGVFTLPDGNQNGWESLSTPTTYTIKNAAINNIAYLGDEQEYTLVGSSTEALMLLPQIFTAASTENLSGVELTIDCKIYQVLEDGSKVYLFGSEDVYDQVKVGISSKKDDVEIWNRGKKVYYNLLFGGGPDTVPIEFSTSVENWENAEGGEVLVF